jgi:four helix bundle protein
MTKNELQDRLIDFSVLIIQLIRGIKKDIAGNTMSNQIVRSGTSVALNYGEALGAESQKDFIHKMQIVLKELSVAISRAALMRQITSRNICVSSNN